MKVILVEPKKEAIEAEIDGSLSGMQKIVGGFIQAVYPFDDAVVLICSEDGKLNGLPLNRALKDEDGNVTDLIAGSFFICGVDDEEFCSLTTEQASKYKDMFFEPELFPSIGGRLLAVKVSAEYLASPERPKVAAKSEVER